MRSRPIFLTLAVAAAAAYPALAASVATQTQHRLRGAATLALINQTGTPPASGTQTTAGPLQLSTSGPRPAELGLGRGAVVAHVSFHGGAFQGSAVMYQREGSISFRARGNVSVNGQAVTFQGHGPITGGAGRYRLASGNISFTGEGQAGASTDRYMITGDLTVPGR